MGFVRRLYVEKRGGFNVKALGLKRDLCENLGVSIGNLRVLYRYDLSGMDDDEIHDGAGERVFGAGGGLGL